jgi:hypothetical protein
MTDTYTPVLTDAEIQSIIGIPKEISFGGAAQIASAMRVCRAIERAAIEAYQRQQIASDAHFDLWQDDMVVASASGPRGQALAEIRHYAAVYAQDGPVQVEEVIRIPLAVITNAPEAQP